MTAQRICILYIIVHIHVPDTWGNISELNFKQSVALFPSMWWKPKKLWLFEHLIKHAKNFVEDLKTRLYILNIWPFACKSRSKSTGKGCILAIWFSWNCNLPNEANRCKQLSDLVFSDAKRKVTNDDPPFLGFWTLRKKYYQDIKKENRD